MLKRVKERIDDGATAMVVSGGWEVARMNCEKFAEMTGYKRISWNQVVAPEGDGVAVFMGGVPAYNGSPEIFNDDDPRWERD